MDFKPEFEEDDNDLDVTGDEQNAPQMLGESDVDALSDYGAGATDVGKFATDEVFSPVDESTIASEADSAVPGADGGAATSEQSPEAADGSEPMNQGPYLDVAIVSENAPPVPSSGGGPIESGVPSSGATSLDTSPNRAASVHAPNSGLSPEAQQMPHPSYERGQPPVCPIVIVRVADDQMEQLVTETRKRVARECANACQDVARQEVHQEFWRRDCEERAILGH